MPFTIKCVCGKVFNVKDELLGRRVRCQVCGAEFIAEPGGAAQPPPPPPPSPASPPFATPPGTIPVGTIPVAVPMAGRACPFCAEMIAGAATVCPFCREVIAPVVSAQDGEAILGEAVARLEQYARDPGNLAADRRERGSMISGRTIVAAAFAALSIVTIVAGALTRGDAGTGIIVMGVITGLIAVPCFIVALVHDWRAVHIQDAPDAAKAFQRYFMCCKTRRYGKAFVTLAPGARSNAAVTPPKFDKIPQDSDVIEISDLDSFVRSCQKTFKGPSGFVRSVALKNVRMEKEMPDGKAWVSAKVQFGSYSKYLYLILLTLPILNIFALLALMIAAMIASKREVKIVKKLLIKRDGRWYVAQADFEGLLDRL